MPKQDVYHILAGAVYLERGFFFSFFPPCTVKAAVCDSLARPFHRAIRAALSSPCQSHRALTFEGSDMRANARRSHVTRAARSPVTSLAHRTCAVSRAGQPERIIPGTRSARSANRTRGMQHVMPRTRARMGTRPFQIQTLAVYLLTVREFFLSQTRSVSAPDSLHVDARARAIRKMWNGPRTRRLVEPERLPK